MEAFILAGMAVLIDNGVLWLITNKTNTLLKIDWDTMEVINVFQIPDQMIREYGYVVMRKVGESLYIFPLYCDNMWRFDIENEAYERIDLMFSGEKMHCKVRIAEITPFGHIFFVDHDTNHYFDFDPERKVVKRLDEELCVDLQARGVDVTKPIYYWQYYRDGNKLFIPLYETNILICFDLDTNQYEISEFDADIKIQGIGGDKEKKIITTTDSRVLLWDGNNTEMLKVELIEKEGAKYLSPFYMQGKALLLPYCLRRLYVKNGTDIKRLEVPYTFIKDNYPEEKGYSQYECFFVKDNRLFFQARSDGTVFCLDVMSEKISKKTIHCSKNMYQAMIAQIIKTKKDYIFEENNIVGLDDYLIAVESTNDYGETEFVHQ